MSVIIILIVIGLIIVLSLIVFAIIYFTSKAKHKKMTKKISSQHSVIIQSLGGKDNIISLHAIGSRISFELKNNDIDEAKLQEIGITNILKSNSKITLVVGELASTLEIEIRRTLGL